MTELASFDCARCRAANIFRPGVHDLLFGRQQPALLFRTYFPQCEQCRRKNTVVLNEQAPAPVLVVGSA